MAAFEFLPGRCYRFHYPGGYTDEARCKGFDEQRQAFLVEFRNDPTAVVTLTDLLINAYKFEEIECETDEASVVIGTPIDTGPDS